MGRAALLCLAALACAGLGAALQCLKCDFTAADAPCDLSAVTCQPGELCATIRGHAAGQKPIVRKNCVAAAKCNTEGAATWAALSYVTYYTCCHGDFCN